MMGEINWGDIRKEFLRPFDVSQMGVKIGARSKDKTKGMALTYIDARTVMDRLDEIVGPDNWTEGYRVVDSGSGTIAVECTISIYGIGKTDVGMSERDGDDERQPKDAKAAYSDAFKRAAVKWGIGRYLYDMPQIWFPLADGGYNFKDSKEDVLRKILSTYNRTATPVEEKKSFAGSTTKDKPEGQAPKTSEIRWSDVAAETEELAAIVEAMGIEVKDGKIVDKNKLNPLLSEWSGQEVGRWDAALNPKNMRAFLAWLKKRM